jgi:hypothetical protein
MSHYWNRSTGESRPLVWYDVCSPFSLIHQLPHARSYTELSEYFPFTSTLIFLTCIRQVPRSSLLWCSDIFILQLCYHCTWRNRILFDVMWLPSTWFNVFKYCKNHMISYFSFSPNFRHWHHLGPFSPMSVFWFVCYLCCQDFFRPW